MEHGVHRAVQFQVHLYIFNFHEV